MLAIVTLLTAVGSFAGLAAPPLAAALPPVCSTADGPEYYAIELVTTKNVPGSGYATGVAEVSVSGASPFSVQLTPDGSYAYDVSISLERIRAPAQGTLVAWLTTSDLGHVERVGALDADFQVSGSVGWNQFLVVITLEAGDDPTQRIWSGPVVLRGLSRSGMMHTMVGHGALQQENCAAYGYR